MDRAWIDRWLPHRPPLRFVDRVDFIALDPPSLRAACWIDPDHPYLVDGRLPPSLVIEATAQAARLLAAVLAAGGPQRAPPPGVGLLGSVEAPILGAAPAGSWLDLAVCELRPIGTATRAVCEARIGEQLVARTVITASTAPLRPR